MFVPKFEILGAAVPEKSLIQISLCITQEWEMENRNKRDMMALYPPPEYHSTQGELKSSHRPRKGCCLKFFFLFLALVAILFSRAEPFSNFGKGVLEEHFCEIILKSGPWPRRRCCLKIFFFWALDAILAVLVEGHLRNIPVKLFQNPLTGLGGDVFQVNCWQMHQSMPFFYF